MKTTNSCTCGANQKNFCKNCSLVAMAVYNSYGNVIARWYSTFYYENKAGLHLPTIAAGMKNRFLKQGKQHQRIVFFDNKTGQKIEV